MKNLTSAELLARTKTLVADERKATVALIEHLEEIQARRLYAELGYASLWEFATCELGLSEGSAQRRIQAMRLVRDVPEAKAALASGDLSLSNGAKLQSFRQSEKKQGRTYDAEKLVKDAHGLSQRECELKLLELSPQSMPQERDHPVAATGERELKIIVSAELHAKLKRLQGLLAHAQPEASYAQLLEYMADEALKGLEKKKGIGLDVDAAVTAAAAMLEKRKKPLAVGKRVVLPSAVKKAVWARSGGRCEVQTGGRRCTSQYRLEIDHITPLARGGSNEFENLRLACKNHNLQLALEKLGNSV